MSLTHFDDKGHAHMVDVSAKPVTDRIAVARGTVVMGAETLAMITEGRAKKGDVLGVARLAGIMGAKKTADLIPLCHPLPITKVALELTPDPALPGIVVEATVKTGGQTGVEMEALTAVNDDFRRRGPDPLLRPCDGLAGRDRSAAPCRRAVHGRTRRGAARPAALRCQRDGWLCRGGRPEGG